MSLVSINKNIGKDSGSTGLILDDILIKIKNLLPENLYYLNINLFSIIIGLILFIICLSIRFKIYKRLLDLKISFLGSLFSLFLFLISPVVNFVKNYNASKKEFAPRKTSKSISRITNRHIINFELRRLYLLKRT